MVRDMSNIKVKICGMTCDEDIALVNRLCCDMAGFVVFYPKSRRNLEIEAAGRLLLQLDGVKSVAVTVSPTPEQIDTIAAAGFDFIQIHGEMSDASYDICTLPIIRAFNDFKAVELEHCLHMEKIDAFLFDAAEPGSGKSFEWSKLSELPVSGKKLFLAGGLTPDNVSEAIRTVRPYAVDVSSGVELPGGGKSPGLTEAFVQNARAVM